MGFLDNLENSLKSLESVEERDRTEEKRREAERERRLAAAPWAERLKSSQYVKDLFEKAALTGHRLRTKIYMAWLGDALRLEAKERRLELRPTANGIEAEFAEPNGDSRKKSVDLEGDPQELLDDWLVLKEEKQ